MAERLSARLRRISTEAETASNLLERLPEWLEASSRDTFHFELHADSDPFWVTLLDDAATYAHRMAEDGTSTDIRELGDRLQLLLDVVAAYRRDVPALLAVVEAVELERSNWDSGCPLCRNESEPTHRSDCPMAKFEEVDHAGS